MGHGSIMGLVVIKWCFCLLYRQYTFICPRHYGLCPLNILIRGLPIKTIRFPVIFCVPRFETYIILKKHMLKGNKLAFLVFCSEVGGRAAALTHPLDCKGVT